MTAPLAGKHELKRNSFMLYFLINLTQKALITQLAPLKPGKKELTAWQLRHHRLDRVKTPVPSLLRFPFGLLSTCATTGDIFATS